MTALPDFGEALLAEYRRHALQPPQDPPRSAEYLAAQRAAAAAVIERVPFEPAPPAWVRTAAMAAAELDRRGRLEGESLEGAARRLNEELQAAVPFAVLLGPRQERGVGRLGDITPEED